MVRGSWFVVRVKVTLFISVTAVSATVSLDLVTPRDLQLEVANLRHEGEYDSVPFHHHYLVVRYAGCVRLRLLIIYSLPFTTDLYLY